MKSLVLGTVLGLVTLIVWAEAARILGGSEIGLNELPILTTDEMKLCYEQRVCVNHELMIMEEAKASYICHEGDSFPDGSSVKDATCHLFQDTNGKVHANWTKLEDCGPILCPKEPVANSMELMSDQAKYKIGVNQTVMCYDGFSFPDGGMVRQRTCVQKMRRNKTLYGAWEPKLGGCMPQE